MNSDIQVISKLISSTLYDTDPNMDETYTEIIIEKLYKKFYHIYQKVDRNIIYRMVVNYRVQRTQKNEIDCYLTFDRTEDDTPESIMRKLKINPNCIGFYYYILENM